MKLFISGQQGFDKRPLSPTGQRVKDLLDRSKDGELFTSTQIALLIKADQQTIQDLTPRLTGYSHLVRGRLRYWGKVKTIKQLQKETA